MILAVNNGLNDMDFTFKTYKELLLTIRSAGYAFQTVQGFVTDPLEKTVILRHDSDIWPGNDLKMACIEGDLGITATYYFRVPGTFNIPVIKKISSLDHEIGYHYEDLAKTGGHYEKAIGSFGHNLALLREVAVIKTISMHGRPLSKWDSRDLWKKYNLTDFGIIAEPYLSIDYNKVLYLTENGNRWDGNRINIRDKVNSSFTLKIRTTFDLMESFRNNELPDQVLLNVHPARWNDNIIIWYYRHILQNMKNIAKFALYIIREKKNTGI